MPTYEYECKSCSHGFEAFQSMSEPPIKECPKCGGEVRRLIFGGAGVIFKGSGFYVTDKGKSSGSAKKQTSAAPRAECPASAECPAKAGGGCPAAEAARSASSESKTETKTA